jgi:hypothetical protein
MAHEVQPWGQEAHTSSAQLGLVAATHGAAQVGGWTGPHGCTPMCCPPIQKARTPHVTPTAAQRVQHM